MRRVALSEVKDDLSKYLRLAEDERIVRVMPAATAKKRWSNYKRRKDGS